MTRKLVVDFLREIDTFRKQKSWKSSKISSKKVTTITGNPGNRRGFSYEAIFPFSHFIFLFHIIFSICSFSFLFYFVFLGCSKSVQKINFSSRLGE